MEDHWYDLVTAALTVICVIGSSANLAVIIIVARNRKVKLQTQLFYLPEVKH